MNHYEFEHCPVTFTIKTIDGKWKLLILYLITNDIRRFGKLSMMLKTISRQMLTTQLRELEKDGIIERVIYPEIPPRVEYFLTDKGKALGPVIESMKDWGLQYNQPETQVERPLMA
ncbi:MAG: helix-turn-helix domain-containing protein [Chryseolinea sp.]